MTVCHSNVIKLWKKKNSTGIVNTVTILSRTHLHQASLRKYLSIKHKIMERDSIWLFGL